VEKDEEFACGKAAAGRIFFTGGCLVTKVALKSRETLLAYATGAALEISLPRVEAQGASKLY
jgi:hypothetical protein